MQCAGGHVFCCGNKGGPPSGGIIGGGSEGGNHFPGGGYSGCGQRNILNVPGWEPEYGQVWNNSKNIIIYRMPHKDHHDNTCIIYIYCSGLFWSLSLGMFAVLTLFGKFNSYAL